MRTSFGEQSIGCSESNALTQVISRHLLASLKMPDQANRMTYQAGTSSSHISQLQCTRWLALDRASEGEYT
jgi:hypothetical protein